MSEELGPTHPNERGMQHQPEELSTPLIAVFVLLVCGLIPALPLYLWRKGRIPAAWGIGVSVAMIVGLIGFGAYGSTVEEPKAKPKAAAPAKTVATRKPSATPKPTISAADKKAALVAKAEKISALDLPDTPYWKGVTFSGTYRTAKKICVDRTKPDGGTAGYVNVYFPKANTGEPQDGTCAKPAPKPVDYQAKVSKAIREELGKSNRDGVKRVDSIVYNNDGGLGAVVIRWAINENITDGLTKKGAKMDVSNMLEVIQKLQKQGLHVKAATFAGTYSLVDQLGNNSEDKVIQAAYGGSTIKQINFNNFLDKNVYDVADDVTIHPAFKD